MHRRTVLAVVVAVNVMVFQVGGCAPPTIPIAVELGGSSVGQFDLEAGVPKRQTTSLDFTATLPIGSGSFQIDPGALSVIPAGGGGGKIRVAAQTASCNAQVEAEGLFGTCIAAGTTEAECSEQLRQAILDCLGDVTTLELTAWIGSLDELDTVFDTGDQYGAFRVTLNEAGQGVSVTPSSITLTQRTRDLLNAGAFSLGFEMIAGDNVSVIFESFTLNLGL